MGIRLSLFAQDANSLLVRPGKGPRAGKALPRRTRGRFAGRPRQIQSGNSVPLVPAEAAGVANSLLLAPASSRGAASPSAAPNLATKDAWAILESMAGTVEGAPDWSSELKHYLYGTPKRHELP